MEIIDKVMRDLFNAEHPEIKIDKPIRLIELFGGYGSQAMALKRLGGISLELYFLCELDKYAVKSYNAIHGTNYKPTNIKDIRGSDLNIKNKDNFYYFMTYSFPCVDLSIAGERKGMRKGDGTRSGLLWEVERILKELASENSLPQLLFMENVPQIISKSNQDDFNSWNSFLNTIGYTSYLKILNAKNYGVAQNRERAFMFSFLGEVFYRFPRPIPLNKSIKDYLEDEVDEKYYLKNKKAKNLIQELIETNAIDIKTKDKMVVDYSINDPQKRSVANCITTKDRGFSNYRQSENLVLETGGISETKNCI